ANDASELEPVFLARLADLAQHLERGRRIEPYRRAVLCEQSKRHVGIEARLAAVREHGDAVWPDGEEAVQQSAGPCPIGRAVVQITVAQIVVRVIDPVVPQHITSNV